MAGDALDEDDETFEVNLSNVTSATISDPRGIGTILDNDALPSVSIGDITVAEGDTGTVAATFAVTLNAPSGRPVTVGYATANNSASSPADYTAASGLVSFAAGETSKQVTVLVAGDALDEGDESFFVNLATPTNATIGDSQGVGTISDDDPLPALSINDVTVTEGSSGSPNATFTVSLNVPSGRIVTVDYATTNGTATAPADYASTTGTLPFAAGETTRTITVPVTGDTIDELEETFTITLSGPLNATIGDDHGVGTITDDDAPPSLSVSDVTVTEGNGSTVSAVFNVTLSAA